MDTNYYVIPPPYCRNHNKPLQMLQKEDNEDEERRMTRNICLQKIVSGYMMSRGQGI